MTPRATRNVRVSDRDAASAAGRPGGRGSVAGAGEPPGRLGPDVQVDAGAEAVGGAGSGQRPELAPVTEGVSAGRSTAWVAAAFGLRRVRRSTYLPSCDSSTLTTM